MDQLGAMTERDWKKLEFYAAQNPGVTLDQNEGGTCVVMEGFGVFHPRSFLDLIAEMPGA
jgi:hypothetical protein